MIVGFHFDGNVNGFFLGTIGSLFPFRKESRFFPKGKERAYGSQEEAIHIAIKVETHNHPTGISPHPGAATGSGGEIRDEGATGRGRKPKAGLAGFSVSDLQIADNPLPWEDGRAHPQRLATPLQIMVP